MLNYIYVLFTCVTAKFLNKRTFNSNHNNKSANVGLLPNPLPSNNLLSINSKSNLIKGISSKDNISTINDNKLKKSPNKNTGVHLPKTLVLDLDETLIHSTSKSPIRNNHSFNFGFRSLLQNTSTGGDGGAHMVEVVLGGRSVLYHVYKRPHLDFFLKKVLLPNVNSIIILLIS